MSLYELIKDEREEAAAEGRVEGKAEGIAEAEFKGACVLLEAMPNIASVEELSRLIDIPLELARRAIASRNSCDHRQSGDASEDGLPD